ncbi:MULTISPECIES: ribonuclease D [Idiomarina]|uniref:ribonuclease D n=1 Tax=Idiomarina TaxID=135575 RepID=UPI000C8F96EB|nr:MULTISPECIES: ribonuclease D [Idiomarina]MAB22168.1 ribonuclease D [Idiomarina sp.]QZN90223.1 ribonuclease D [Idiomarina abyssalis]
MTLPLNLPESVRQYRLVTETQELERLCQQAREAGWFAIDSEFVRERTYYAQLGLLQIYANGTTAVVDPLADIDLEPLWELIADDSVETVLHAGGEDIELFFQQSNGRQPNRIFDSQIAAGFCGLGDSMGYARLVDALFDGVELDKSLSRTNWLKRPLSEEQLDYAAADASYLAVMYPYLKALCEEKGCLDIVYEESQIQVRKRTQSWPDDLLYLAVGNAWQLNARQLGALKILTPWRLHKARERDIPLGFIAKDGVLLELARRMPKSDEELSRIPDLAPMSRKYSGRDIIRCIQQAEQVSESELPKTLERLDDMEGYKPTFKAIKKVVSELADKLQVPASLVASRKQINDVINFHWQYSTQQQQRLPQPDLMMGWRKQAIGAELQAIIG